MFINLLLLLLYVRILSCLMVVKIFSIFLFESFKNFSFLSIWSICKSFWACMHVFVCVCVCVCVCGVSYELCFPIKIPNFSGLFASFLAMMLNLWDLSYPTSDWTWAKAVKGWNPNHQATGELPSRPFIDWSIFSIDGNTILPYIKFLFMQGSVYRPFNLFHWFIFLSLSQSYAVLIAVIL